MRKALRHKTSTIILFGFVLFVAHTTHPNEPDEMSWIVGTWERQSTKAITYESWRRLSDRTYEGESYRVSRDNRDTVFAESMLLVEMGREMFYIPKVDENAYPVPFRLTVLEDGKAVFENPEHDFPQRITYSRNPDGSLSVSVETIDREKRIEFNFTRRK